MRLRPRVEGSERAHAVLSEGHTPQPVRTPVAEGVAALGVGERAGHLGAGLSQEMADALTLMLAARRRAEAPAEVARLAQLTAAAGWPGQIAKTIELAEQTLQLALAAPQIAEAAPGQLYTAVLQAQSALRTEAKLPYGKPLEEPQRRRAIQHVAATWADAPRTADAPPLPRMSVRSAEFLGGGKLQFRDDVAAGVRLRDAFTAVSGPRRMVDSDHAPAQSIGAFCANETRSAMSLRAFARPAFEDALVEARQIAARLPLKESDAAHRSLAYAASAHNLHTEARAFAEKIHDPQLRRDVAAHVDGCQIVAAGFAASQDALATLAEARGETLLASERRHDARFLRGE